MNPLRRMLNTMVIGFVLYRLASAGPQQMADNPVGTAILLGLLGFAGYNEVMHHRHGLAHRLNPLLKTVAHDRPLVAALKERAAGFDQAFEWSAYREGGRGVMWCRYPAGFNTGGKPLRHLCLIVASDRNGSDIRIALFDTGREPRDRKARNAALAAPSPSITITGMHQQAVPPDAANRWHRVEMLPGMNEFAFGFTVSTIAAQVATGLADGLDATAIMPDLIKAVRDHLFGTLKRRLKMKPDAPLPATGAATTPAARTAGFWDRAIQAARRTDGPTARPGFVADLDSGMATEAAIARATGLDPRLVAAIAASDWTHWSRDHSLGANPFWRDGFPARDDQKAGERLRIIAHLTAAGLPRDKDGWLALGRAIQAGEILAGVYGIEPLLALPASTMTGLPRFYQHQLDALRSDIAVYLLAPLVPDRPDPRQAKSLEPAANRLLARLPPDRLTTILSGGLSAAVRGLVAQAADSRPLPALPFAVAPDGTGIGGFDTAKAMKRSGARISAAPAEPGRHLVRIERPGRYGAPLLVTVTGGPPFAADTQGLPALDWYVAGLNDGSILLDASALDALMRDDAAHRAAVDPRLGYAPGDAALRDRIFSLFRTPFDLAPDMSRSTWEEAVGLPLVAGSR